MKIGYKPNLWHLMKLIDRNGLTDLVERTGHRGDRIMNIIMVMSLFHCPMCASPASLEEFMVSETMFRQGHIATYAQCLRCNSLVRTSVLPPQSLLYPDNYYSLSRDAESALSGPMRHWLCTRLAKSTFSESAAFIKLLRLFAPIRELRTVCQMLLSINFASHKRNINAILDVGTGSGYLPFILSRNGRQVLGIDPFSAREWSSGTCKIRKLSINELTEKFDLIMFHHSLEHISDPGETLNTAASLLNNDGVIVIRIPKCDSEAWRIYGPDWFQIDAPRHEFIPSNEGMHLLVGSQNLRIVHQYDDSTSAQFWLSNIVAKGLSLMNPNKQFEKFRADDSSLYLKVSHVLRTRSANRKANGDQTVLIVTRDSISSTNKTNSNSDAV